MAGNIFQDGMNAYADTNSIISGIQKKRADTQAAPMIAAGNFGGAAQAYGSAGLPDEARQQVVDQQVMQDRSAASDTRAKAEQAAEAQRRADGLLHVVDAVQAAPVGQRLSRLQALAPAMHSLGVDPSQLSAASEADLSDDKLASFKALVGKAAQDYTLGGGRYSGGTNKLIAGTVSLDPTKLNYGPDDGSGTAPPAAAPAPAPPAAAPAPQMSSAPASGSPRGLRNNNPLNITGQGWNGQTGSDGKFAQFGSIDDGIRAADKNLAAYGSRHGINTLSGVISRWAPASDNNNVQAYVQTVAHDTGLDPTGPIDLGDPKVRSIILHSMAKVETGQANPFSTTLAARPTPSATSAGVPAAATADAPAPQMPGMRLLNSPQKAWQDLDSPDHQRNVITGETRGKAPDPDEAPLTPAAVDMNATRFAMTGTMPTGTGMGKTATANKTKIQNRAADLIQEWGVKPEDWVTGVAQYKIAQGSLSKISQTRNLVQASENAVLANMNTVVLPLLDKVQPGGIPFLNKYTMAVKDRAFGDPNVKAYDNALHTVADEYAKVMTTTTGTGGQGSSDSARAEAYRRLSTSQTAPQLKATFAALQAEMANRRAALVQQEQALTGQLRTGLAPPGQPTAQPGGASSPLPPPDRRFNPATGRLE